MFNFDNRTTSYTPDTISRNIKRVRKGVIEIRRYSEAKFKQFIWLWIIALFGVLGFNPESRTNIYKDIEWAISPDIRLVPQYNELKEILISLGKKYPTYEEFKNRMLKRHGSRRYTGAFAMFFPVFLFFMLISPNWRPLRIDTNRRIAYFWLFGKFYITRYDERTNPIKTFQPYSYQSRLTNPEHAALVLTIPHETDPDDKVRVDLGIFRPACDFQDQVLREFLTDYMQSLNPDEEFARYFKKEKRLWSDYINFFYHLSLFPTRGYNEKKTEAKIQQWLENNPEIY
ncbi:hypothetical protein PHA51_11210 [Rodentibacter pneumotropicus]|uniref:hypothetical protein n=1 Tax=Rodentibacter pneumotropicus TaxID=758 RepID=UPI00232B26EB|nr:hypothetical protein [Rodentibacter pneumotropicus]MDC2826584.1 hypothetical protein [Rodentibacter pneumotropicus]